MRLSIDTDENRATLEWFFDLQDCLRVGDYQIATQMVDGAVELYRRKCQQDDSDIVEYSMALG